MDGENKLPGEVVDVPSLETFKVMSDRGAKKSGLVERVPDHGSGAGLDDV